MLGAVYAYTHMIVGGANFGSGVLMESLGGETAIL